MVIPFYPFAFLARKINCTQQKDVFMGIPFRPLGLVSTIVERMGLGVTYSYEDLVFISHNAFMLRFGEEGELLDLLFNHECPQKERDAIETQLKALCEENGLTLTYKGTYELVQGSSQNLSIKFFEDSDTATATQ